MVASLARKQRRERRAEKAVEKKSATDELAELTARAEKEQAEAGERIFKDCVARLEAIGFVLIASVWHDGDGEHGQIFKLKKKPQA